MCIAISKPRGVEPPTKKTLQICFENNDDGCGFMFSKGGVVRVHKGFMTFKDFWQTYKGYNLGKADSIVYHFRIATTGAVTPENCHPFPLTKELKGLRSKKIDVPHGVAHNGILDITPKDGVSDTMEFIRRTLSIPWILEKAVFGSEEEFTNFLDCMIVGSKLAFLKADGEQVLMGGEWLEKDGIFYSNSSYMAVWSWKNSEYYYPTYKTWFESAETVLDKSAIDITSLEQDPEVTCIDCGDTCTESEAMDTSTIFGKHRFALTCMSCGSEMYLTESLGLSSIEGSELVPLEVKANAREK